MVKLSSSGLLQGLAEAFGYFPIDLGASGHPSLCLASARLWVVSEGVNERLGRLVLASCEAFENYPPGIPGRALAQAASIPGGLYLAFQSLRLRPLRRLPTTWGWMSKRPVPDEVMNEWIRPLQSQPEIRRDLRKYALSIPPKKVLLE